MKRLLQDWAIAIGVALALIAGASVLDHANRPSGTAPPLALVDIQGGKLDLAELKGKVVVVNFWGSWCGPCRAEIPEISKWAVAHPDIPVLGVAVNSGTGAKLAADVAELKITYKVLEGTNQVVTDWRVDAFPTTFVIGKDGNIKAVKAGRLTLDELQELVDEAGA